MNQRFWVGTSGFGYREWKGKFYPKNLPASALLPYYAERFDAVEINSSFYRIPAPSVVRGWANQTGPGFVFCFKAPGQITHRRRLKDSGPEFERFLKAIAAAGAKRGAVVFQTPPNFKKNLARLESFLKTLPRRGRFAFEFRHPSWFDEDVLACLRRRRAALCLNDADVDGCPLAATADWGIVKLRRTVYSSAELRTWARRLRAQPWKRAFVFFKHEDRATGPALAAKLRSLL